MEDSNTIQSSSSLQAEQLPHAEVIGQLARLETKQIVSMHGTFCTVLNMLKYILLRYTLSHGVDMQCLQPQPLCILYCVRSAIQTSTVHMQVKGHKSKSRKRKLEDTSRSDRSVLIDDIGETQCGDDVCLWSCTYHLLCHCCTGPTFVLLCNAVRHLQILMIANPSSLRAGTATSRNHDDNRRVFCCT